MGFYNPANFCVILCWYKHNFDFCIVEICHLILEYILKQMSCYISF